MALGPAFAAGLAMQQLLELLDAGASALLRAETRKTTWDNVKKCVLGVVSLLIGLSTAWAGLRVLAPLGLTKADGLDFLVTAFVISAGTEGLNSIMKFLGYAKAEKKAEAQKEKAEAAKERMERVSAQGGPAMPAISIAQPAASPAL